MVAVQGKKPSKLPWWAWAIIVVLFVFWFMGQDNDPCPPEGCKQPPPSVPTDVGTLKP